jgi:hypothetical protein
MRDFFLFHPTIFPIEMTGLNQGVANSRDGYTSRQIDEYWRLTEKLVYTQQSESGYYAPLVKTVAKEGGCISGNVKFQIFLVEPRACMICTMLILSSTSKENLFTQLILNWDHQPQFFSMFKTYRFI